MKTRPNRIKSYGLLYGKLPLILYTVLICSLSFILGYYVGKGTRTNTEKVISEEKPAINTKEEKPKSEPVEKVAEKVNKPETETVKKEAPKKEPPKPKPATVEETKPFPIQSKTANYYTIQVGAFSSKAEAEKLKRRLKKKGYTVFINTSKRGKILYRVRVGRFLKRSDAEAAALKLSINEKLKTFIVTQKGTK